jgi:hypothetical protein
MHLADVKNSHKQHAIRLPPFLDYHWLGGLGLKITLALFSIHNISRPLGFNFLLILKFVPSTSANQSL